MKHVPRNLLFGFLLVSLAVHLGFLGLLPGKPGPAPEAQLAVTLVASAEETTAADGEKDGAALEDHGMQRFRPNEAAPDEPGEPEAADDTREAPTSADSGTALPEDDPSRAEIGGEDSRETPDAPREPSSEARNAHHEESPRDFDPDWQAVPDLVVIADAETQRTVSEFFGMKLIAYPKGEKKPSYVVVIDEKKDTFEYKRDFDFTRYSNRAKDRSNLPEYARLARRIKSRLGLPEVLAIVSLVPAEVDRYFAARQMEVVQASGICPEDVVRTEGRYDRDARSGYKLLIDRLVLKNGQRVGVADRREGGVASRAPADGKAR